MNNGELISMAINIAVGIYLAFFYPKAVQRSFRGQRTPRAFAILSKVLPVLGVVLIVGTVVFTALRLSGGID